MSNVRQKEICLSTFETTVRVDVEPYQVRTAVPGTTIVPVGENQPPLLLYYCLTIRVPGTAVLVV